MPEASLGRVVRPLGIGVLPRQSEELIAGTWRPSELLGTWESLGLGNLGLCRRPSEARRAFGVLVGLQAAYLGMEGKATGNC